MANVLAGNFENAHKYLDRAIAIYRELDIRFRLAGALTTRGGVSYHDMSIIQPREVTEAANLSTNEALQLSREIGWLAGESFALWVLSLNIASQGKIGPAPTATGFKAWIVSKRSKGSTISPAGHKS